MATFLFQAATRLTTSDGIYCVDPHGHARGLPSEVFSRGDATRRRAAARVWPWLETPELNLQHPDRQIPELRPGVRGTLLEQPSGLETDRACVGMSFNVLNHGVPVDVADASWIWEFRTCIRHSNCVRGNRAYGVGRCSK